MKHKGNCRRASGKQNGSTSSALRVSLTTTTPQQVDITTQISCRDRHDATLPDVLNQFFRPVWHHERRSCSNSQTSRSSSSDIRWGKWWRALTSTRQLAQMEYQAGSWRCVLISWLTSRLTDLFPHASNLPPPSLCPENLLWSAWMTFSP